MASGGSDGKLGVKAYYNQAVPLTLHKETIVVKFTGPNTEKGKTAHLDLVVVLDISASMQGQKLQEMKQAAEFVIRKVGTLDTLTFVPFSYKAWKPSAMPPVHMSARAKQEAIHFVKGLTAQGNTNIKDGLHTAVRILRGRSDKTGRAAGIFLMSDGEQNNGDARDVHVHDFPVFTFGFGHEHDQHLLYDIARKSHGGTYQNTQRSSVRNNLLAYFAQILGILRDVSTLNLAVTIKPYAEATILEVDPGNYQVMAGNRSFTIHFGELAREEQRRIKIVIQLPAVLNSQRARTVLGVEYSYRIPKQRESSESYYIYMARDRSARPAAPRGRVLAELARRDQARRIKRMKILADAKRLDRAMDELAEAKNALRIIESTQHFMKLLNALSLELEYLEELLESHEVYNKRGRAYMLAAISSHDRQRFVARGGDGDVMLYAELPRLLKYARQANEFQRKPNAARI